MSNIKVILFNMSPVKRHNTYTVISNGRQIVLPSPLEHSIYGIQSVLLSQIKPNDENVLVFFDGPRPYIDRYIKELSNDQRYSKENIKISFQYVDKGVLNEIFSKSS